MSVSHHLYTHERWEQIQNLSSIRIDNLPKGDGDRSLAYWRKVHKEFFTEELASIDRKFDEEMQLVCEEFELV